MIIDLAGIDDILKLEPRILYFVVESSEVIVTFMLSFSVLLVVISAVHHYMRHIIIPGVAILMFLGAILPVVPNLTHNVEDFYGITERIPELILYVIIPILIF